MEHQSFEQQDAEGLLDHLTAPAWVFDVENQRIRYANAEGLAFWCAGSATELTQREFSSDSASVMDRLTTILETTASDGTVQETWTLYPAGVPQMVVLTFRHVLLEQGRGGLLVEVAETFTDRMGDAARMADVFQTTPSLITVMGLEGRVLVQNAAALKCYGPALPSDGDTLDINFRYPNSELSTRILSGAHENKILRFETEVQTRTGARVHYIWIKRGRDPVTGDPTIAITEEDISDISGLYAQQIKRAAELEHIVEDRTDRLRVTQERMKRGLELAATWDWDIAKNRLYFSANFIALLEYEKAELYKKMRTEGFKSLINPDDYASYPAALEASLADPESPVSFDLRFVTKSGKNLWIQIEGKCYCDAQGIPVRTAGLLTNITHRKELEKKLRAAQKLEAIGKLTGGIAHDFNNLLTVIQGNAQLLQELGQAEEELTSEIVNAVQRGADLTRHMLAFAGKQSLEPRPLDVARLLGDMRSTLLRVLSETIATSITTSDDLWAAFADQAQTEAALLNLALNARDAMTKGGALRITARNFTVGPAAVPLHADLKPGDYVRISVTDTGKGMTAEVIEKAFEPFFTTKGIGEGSGLGLSMVMGFSRQSGGGVQIESAAQAGTTISVYLPRAQEDCAAKDHALASAPKIGRGERVHILEDNADVAATVARMSASLNYLVTSSATVKDALVAARQDPSIDVFMIDVILPGGQSGIDFASELVKFRPEAKLIVMSGYPQDEFARDTAQSFQFTFLAKPFSRLDLSKAIDEALHA
ncbi:ATP-binding protein [Sulfitobacter sp. HNIBRBA2951]|uniref:ATP-binding protein n=1 Tax=Sulfitobacter aquimarinus TaxID=3158557 RepID=UPI0032DE7CD5